MAILSSDPFDSDSDTPVVKVKPLAATAPKMTFSSPASLKTNPVYASFTSAQKAPRRVKSADDDAKTEAIKKAFADQTISQVAGVQPSWKYATMGNPYPDNAAEVPMPAPMAPWGHIAQPAPAVQPPAAIEPPINLGSLRAFVAGGAEFDGSEWTTGHIADALTHELWRARDIDEIIKEGDLLYFDETDGQPAFYDQVRGYKDTQITKEQVELHGYIVWTLEGGGKPRKPIVYRETSEYPSGLLSVPKATFVKMPTDQTEAKRFFDGDVFSLDAVDPQTRKPVKVFAPMPTRFANREFRQTFSRVFPDIARKHFKDHIKGLIEGRGLGIQLKRGVSINRILDMIDGRKRGVQVDKHKPMTAEQVAQKLGLSVDLVNKVVAKRDYRHLEDGRPVLPFAQRMEARDLTPVDYRYDKAIGIEIEAVTPVNPTDAQVRMPSYVKVTTDGSLRNDKDQKMSPGGANDAASLAKGLDGLYGLEYRMLIKRSEMEVRIIKAATAIFNLGAKVNKSCGLHVHFDMRDKSLDQTIELGDKLTKWLKCLRELLPASRRANQYCSFDQVANKHHWAVSSYDSYNKHKTLEVRVHSSTLNTTKIINWVRLIETIIETRFPPVGSPTTVDALKMLGLTEADRTYWLKRHQQLNPELYRGSAISLDFLGERAINEIE